MNPILGNTLDIKNAPRDEVIAALLDAVRTSRDSSSQIIHYPFGLIRVPFYSDKGEDGMALHLWSKAYFAQESLHTHVFNLQSRVLYGSITNKLWEVAPGTPTHRQVQITYQGSDQTPENVDSVHLKIAHFETFDWVNSSYYELPRGVAHSSEASEGAMTLIRRQNVAGSKVRVFIPEEDARNLPLESPPEVTWETVQNAVEQLITASKDAVS